MKNLYWAAALAASLSLGGCAVYVPKVPSTPLLTKSQVRNNARPARPQLAGTGRSLGHTSHLLLAAESALQSSNNETTTNHVTTTYRDTHRQTSPGLGYYQAPSAHSAWYLAVGRWGRASQRAAAKRRVWHFFALCAHSATLGIGVLRGVLPALLRAAPRCAAPLSITTASTSTGRPWPRPIAFY